MAATISARPPRVPPRLSAPATTTAAATAPTSPPITPPPISVQSSITAPATAPAAPASTTAATRPSGVAARRPAKSTPSAVPSPSARPIVYQSPIAVQCSFDAAVFWTYNRRLDHSHRPGGTFSDRSRTAVARILLVRTLGTRPPDGEPARSPRAQGAAAPARPPRRRGREARSSPSASRSTSYRRSCSSRTGKPSSRLDGRTSAPRIEAMLEPHLPRELAVA